MLHASKLPVHPLSDLLQRISHLCSDMQDIQTLTTPQPAQPCIDNMLLKQWCVQLKAWLLGVLVSTHLPDVPHLIVKVTDCPLSCHHLLLSARARSLHYTIHFGPMMLQCGRWHPIGHVTEVLRETGSHRSGFCSHPPLRLT